MPCTGHSSTAGGHRRVLELGGFGDSWGSGRRIGISEAERPYLVVLQGPSLGDFFALDGDELVLGSDPFHADVVVRDVEVEPRHAKIYRESGTEYVLEDLGTGKATTVNGETLEGERTLSDGDRIS